MNVPSDGSRSMASPPAFCAACSWALVMGCMASDELLPATSFKACIAGCVYCSFRNFKVLLVTLTAVVPNSHLRMG